MTIVETKTQLTFLKLNSGNTNQESCHQGTTNKTTSKAPFVSSHASVTQSKSQNIKITVNKQCGLPR